MVTLNMFDLLPAKINPMNLNKNANVAKNRDIAINSEKLFGNPKSIIIFLIYQNVLQLPNPFYKKYAQSITYKNDLPMPSLTLGSSVTLVCLDSQSLAV